MSVVNLCSKRPFLGLGSTGVVVVLAIAVLLVVPLVEGRGGRRGGKGKGKSNLQFAQVAEFSLIQRELADNRESFLLSMATISGDFGSEQYGRIAKMAATISNDEKRFRFAIGQIKLIEESLDDGIDKTMLVKRLVNWALQLFNKIADFKSDVRMLYLWKLLGKYSVELKMEGVLKKVNELGFFKTAPEFYFIWAEYFAEKSDREKFDAVVLLCRDNCRFGSNTANQLFGPLIRAHFDEDGLGETADLLDMIDHKSPTQKDGGNAEENTTKLDATELDKSSDPQKLTTFLNTAQEFSVDKPEVLDGETDKPSFLPAVPATKHSDSYSFQNIRMIDFGADETSGVPDFSSMGSVFSPYNAAAMLYDTKKSVSNFSLEKSCSMIEDSPSMTQCKKIDLGSQQFHILKLIHEGDFAKVFLASSREDGLYALKQQVHSPQWEIQILEELKNRLLPSAWHFIMQNHSVRKYSNSCVVVRDYYPLGTLRDLTIIYKNYNVEVNGLLVAFLGVQLASVLEQIHSAKIIHARLQPGSVYLTQPFLSHDVPVDEMLRTPSIKIADWGKSIDMKQFGDGKQFTGRSESEEVHCVEMISNKPWNYQVDYYGFIQVFHFLMLGDVITTVRNQGKIRPVRAMKRGMALRLMWMEIFDELLNIPSCESLPSWSQISSMIQRELQKEIGEKPGEWKEMLDDYNAYTKNIQ